MKYLNEILTQNLINKIKSLFSSLATVATSGSYNDLTNAPTSLPANGGTASRLTRDMAGADVARCVWFSDSADPSRLVFDEDFKYNPFTNILTVGGFSGNSLQTLSAAGYIHSDWYSDNSVPSMNFLRFWNGRISGETSNLAYCNQGAFGTAVTQNTSNFLGNETGYSYPYANGVDLNVIKEEYHKFVINSTNSPSGSTRHGFLDVSFYNGTGFTPTGEKPIVKQIFSDYYFHYLYVRYYSEYGKSWSNWTKISMEGDYCSEIEIDDSGDETTENYVRFSNGFCVQWGSKANVTSGTSFTFPYAFTDIPSVSVNRGIVGSITTGGFTMTADSAASDDTIYYAAVGYIA